MKHEYDFLVIGAGSGGVRAARFAATLGAKTLVCEDARLGGTCVNLGCVPKKLLMYGSRYGHHAADAAGFGWSREEPRFDWPALIERKDREIHRLNGVYQRVLEGAGAEIRRGRGRLVDAHTVEIAGERVTARYILVATGSRPFVPPVPGAELGVVSDALFSLPALPRRIVVVGGGYIGVEFASIFRGFGSEVAQIHRGDLLLSGFDDEIALFLGEEMVKKGIDLRLGCQVESIEQAKGGLRASLGGGHRIDADLVLWATGRSPNTAGLGLEEAGVETGKKGEIVVDDRFQTSVPSIYACGDVIGRFPLTPVALAEGMRIAKNLFGGGEPQPVDYAEIPTAVFSDPNVGTVGLTETQARRQFKRIDVYKSTFKPMKHTLSGRDERTLMKLVVDRDSDRVLGCHMVGDEAGEIIQGFAVALRAGATKSVFDATIGIHPTAAEEFVTMRTPVPPADIPD